MTDQEVAPPVTAEEDPDVCPWCGEYGPDDFENCPVRALAAHDLGDGE